MASKRDRTTDETRDKMKFTEKSDGTVSDDESSLEGWVAPEPIARPTLFSGGGEDPLAQLDSYCRSNSIQGSATVADPDELLSVADFLFGQKALMAALTIVDSRRTLITRLVAPSGRSVHLIRSSTDHSASVKEPNDRNTNENYYLCLLSSPSPSPSQFSRSNRYCSCRSFLEKSAKKATALAVVLAGASAPRSGMITNVNDETYHDGPPVCKHLLALFLLPHLAAASVNGAPHSSNASRSYHSSYPEVKSITEKEFARFILDRVS